jgi:hypothetical protein
VEVVEAVEFFARKDQAIPFCPNRAEPGIPEWSSTNGAAQRAVLECLKQLEALEEGPGLAFGKSRDDCSCGHAPSLAPTCESLTLGLALEDRVVLCDADELPALLAELVEAFSMPGPMIFLRLRARYSRLAIVFLLSIANRLLFRMVTSGAVANLGSGFQVCLMSGSLARSHRLRPSSEGRRR